MKKVLIKLKACVGETVVVNNYRMKEDVWEEGEVKEVNVGINKNLAYKVQYSVLLHRRSLSKKRMYKDGGRPILLVVGDDKLKKI